MRLLLVRHPRPGVDPGLCYGSSDVVAPAHETARVRDALRAAGLPGTMPTYASPLERCAALARSLDPSPLRFDARLAEMDFGAWELRSWDTIARSEIDAWADDLLHYRPGGGESVLDVARRVAAFLDDMRAELRGARQPQALVICHAGTMRLLRALFTGQPLITAALEAARTPHRIGYGELLVLKD
ncbi:MULTISPECIES: histidine phosphatase family protein [Massilia]|uniref:Histidine phosphatase family protein n=1 Tax=Massilia haematophila TaxID=457923 RepID=A0ABV7PQP5_9BURK|nr:histidine phosphatase family protein [Massilia sp.]HBZ05752.1 phosphoglycerate mutase [Massilia sp.]